MNRKGHRPRVLCFIVSYPTFSETYMHEEIRGLRDRFDIEIITYRRTEIPRKSAFPYRLIEYNDTCLQYGDWIAVDPHFRTEGQRRFIEAVDEVIREFRPDFMHAHYLGFALLLKHLGERHAIPWTVRTHSMDVLSEPEGKLQRLCAAANTEHCRRVLAFPGHRQRLTGAGLESGKLTDVWPVLNFQRFHRPEPREPTGRVLCAGPAIRKKAHEKFIELAATMADSSLRFDLYAAGPTLEACARRNTELQNPARITYADPDDMPDVYPWYDWLVYPSDTGINKVGLPLAAAEAMAAGLGVCLQELPGRREEQLDFLGGAGYLFSDIEEVPAILSAGYPDEKRRAGFESARRFDLQSHKHLLTDAWVR